MEEFSVKKESGKFKLNRRTTKRIKFLKKVKFGIGDAVFPGSSYNISQKGILIHSFKAFLPNTTLSIKIYNDSEVIDVNAEVKWVTKTIDHTGSFMGLYFTGKNFELSKLYLKELKISQIQNLSH